MADEPGSSNNRKKALIVGVLAFLFTGGGVFLFFVIQGSDDLTGANKKNAFTYGGAAREATASFFKFIGFDDVESISKDTAKERLRIKEYASAGLLDSPEAAGKSDEDVPWAAPAASGRSASPSNIPKMGGSGTSGVGGLGGGGTKSSGGVSRFGDGSSAGETKISARTQGGAAGAAGKGSLASLASARAMLGDGLRSGSASTAKAKWDSSFGVGRAGGGAGSEMAYARSGLVGLDKIKKGEVDNLKTTDVKSLKVPEVGAPKKDEKADEADPVLKKAKETAEDAIAKSMASSMAGALGQGVSESMSGPAGNRMESGECSAGASSPVCSHAMQDKMDTDSGITYRQTGTTSEGKLMQVTYSGMGPGITDQYKGQNVPYNDVCNVLVRPDGTVKVLGWADPVEGPAAIKR